MFESIPIRDVFPRVLAYTPNAPDPAIREAVLRGARRLCRQTQCWREWMGPTEPLEGVTRYQLMVPMDAELCAVVAAAPEGLRAVVQVVSGGMYVTVDFPEPPREAFSIEAAFMPTMEAEHIPALLVNEWDDVLVAGSLAFIMDVPKSDWTDHNFAAHQDRLFRQGVGRTRIALAQGRRNDRLTVRKPRFI